MPIDGLINWKPVTFQGDSEDFNTISNTQDIVKCVTAFTTFIETGKGDRSTGFFTKIEETPFLVTASHSIGEGDDIYVSDYDLGELEKKINEYCLINVFYQEKISEGAEPELAGEDQDLETNHPKIPLLPHFPLNEDINVGDKVYFFGYPFGKPEPIFHQGMISSINGNKFSIDGTIVPGHSGSPVVVVKKVGDEEEKKLFLLGMICSVGVHDANALEYLASHQDNEIRKIGNFLASNLSPGIGWAVDIRTFEKVVIEGEPNNQDWPVKIQFLRTASYTDPVTKEIKNQDVEFLELKPNRRGGGTGPRSLQVILSGKADAKYTYKLTNPHKAPKYNHKGQEEFYKAAADEFIKEYEKLKLENHPEEFEFEFGGHDFSAKFS